jgi:hypothetical protein
LFANRNAGPTSATSPSLAQPGGPYGASTQYDESQPMTEEEIANAEVDGYKAQILQEKAGTNESGRRNRAHLARANEQMMAINNQLLQDSDVLNRAERNMAATSISEASLTCIDDQLLMGLQQPMRRSAA